jgi:hypothetical protein
LPWDCNRPLTPTLTCRGRHKKIHNDGHNTPQQLHTPRWPRFHLLTAVTCTLTLSWPIANICLPPRALPCSFLLKLAATPAEQLSTLISMSCTDIPKWPPTLEAMIVLAHMTQASTMPIVATRSRRHLAPCYLGQLLHYAARSHASSLNSLQRLLIGFRAVPAETTGRARCHDARHTAACVSAHPCL